MTEPFDLLVVGGSAGALEAVVELVGALPLSVACPIAIVLHIPPRVPSLLPSVLARATARPVREAEDKEPLAPHTIYVAPPDYHLLVERDRHVSLSVDEPVHFSRPSIDVLFESAADALGARVAALLLSGSNEDGARGLARVATAGGLALVQDPAAAAFSTMPAAGARLAPRARAVNVAEVVDLLAMMTGVVPEERPR